MSCGQEVEPSVGYWGTQLKGEQEGQGLWGYPRLVGGLPSPRRKGSFPAGWGTQGGAGERRPSLQPGGEVVHAGLGGGVCACA